MALQGTLEDFGIADIFQLIGQQQKTGLLVLSRQERVVHIFFSEGNIVAAEDRHRGRSERIGEMMVEGGLIQKNQLAQSLEIQKKTLQKLGSILVDEGFVKKSELDEFVYLQAKETIFRLFRWNSGTYEFLQQEVPDRSEFFQPMSAEHILMDGFRMIDEWPSIRKKIGSFDTIFEHHPEKGMHLKADLGQQRVDQEEESSFKAWSDAEKDDLTPPRMAPNEQRIYELVDGSRMVRQLISHSRLGEFESCLALCSLMDQGFVRPLKTTRALPIAKGKRSIDLYQDYGVSRSNWAAVLPELIYYGCYFLVLFVFLSYFGVGPFQRFRDTGRQKIQKPIFRELQSDYQLARIETALNVFFLEKGYYPRKMDDLVTNALLAPRDLQFPWRGDYVYSSDGSSFSLEKPFF